MIYVATVCPYLLLTITMVLRKYPKRPKFIAEMATVFSLDRFP